MSETVFANTDSLVSDCEGGLRLLTVNEPFAADHPIVLAHPEMFNASPHLRDGDYGTVESATANPGERRSMRRG